MTNCFPAFADFLRGFVTGHTSEHERERPRVLCSWLEPAQPGDARQVFPTIPSLRDRSVVSPNAKKAAIDLPQRVRDGDRGDGSVVPAFQGREVGARFDAR